MRYHYPAELVGEGEEVAHPGAYYADDGGELAAPCEAFSLPFARLQHLVRGINHYDKRQVVRNIAEVNQKRRCFIGFDEHVAYRNVE